MSFVSENIVPGNRGKIFSTNAKEDIDLEKIENAIMEVNGIKEVVMNKDVYPREFTIYTSKMVQVKEVENKIKTVGFHAIPKGLFEL